MPVHEGHVRPVLPMERHRLLTVLGLSRDRQVRLGENDGGESGADRRVVVGDEDPEAIGGWLWLGHTGPLAKAPNNGRPPRRAIPRSGRVGG